MLLESVRIPKAKGPVDIKYLKNVRDGRRGLNQGIAERFGRLPEGIYDGYSLLLLPDKISGEQIHQRIIDPVLEAASEAGILLFHSGSHWPHHMTVADLRWNPETGTSRDEFFDELRHDPQFNRVAQSLIGTTIRFDTLWGGKIITAAARDIPDNILSARKVIDSFAEGRKVSVKDLRNIAHISAAQFAPFESTYGTSPDYNAFGRALMEIHYGLMRNPISVTFESTLSEPNIYILKKAEPVLYVLDRLAENSLN